jgi:tRNA (Guanine-1)-methyltransferase
LTGGEVAALAVVEAAVRLIPGALNDAESADFDSFSDGVLDWPHYTRPATVRGHGVPEVLLSGDHGKVARWRRKEALRATRERRPDLLAEATLSATDREILREIEPQTEIEPSLVSARRSASVELNGGSRGDEELNPRTSAPQSPLASEADREAVGLGRIKSRESEFQS